jgi:sugar lactone lactonase YvrE
MPSPGNTAIWKWRIGNGASAHYGIDTVSDVSRVALQDLEPFGASLQRPECVIPLRSGDVFVPAWPGGVSVVRADGSVHTWRARETSTDLRPNGIAPTRDGAFLIANLGDDGGVWRLERDGQLFPFLLEVDGVALPPANFVTIDLQGRTWITVSTRRRPRQLAWRPDVADGFIVLVDERGPRIVADGLHYTNELRLDADGQALWVAETFGRRIRRFPVHPSGVLGAPEIVLAIDREWFPDGLAFDAEGGLWVTSLISNRLLRLHDDRLQTVLEDVNPDFVLSVDRAFAAGEMIAQHLGPVPGTTLGQLTSVGFGGPDAKTVYLGTLHGSALYRFRTTVAGADMPYWTYPAG